MIKPIAASVAGLVAFVFFAHLYTMHHTEKETSDNPLASVAAYIDPSEKRSDPIKTPASSGNRTTYSPAWSAYDAKLKRNREEEIMRCARKTLSSYPDPIPYGSVPSAMQHITDKCS